jgi:hypothetical protein
VPPYSAPALSKYWLIGYDSGMRVAEQC